MTALDELADWPGRATAGWLHRDGECRTAGDPTDVFALASVTKLLSTAALLVAVQEAILELDEPAGPPGSTVRLLLCHASGLSHDRDVPIAPPGRRRVYGNAAFEVLGDLLVERAGMPFGDYVHEAVCAPLGMAATEVRGSPAHSGHSTLADLLRFGRELLAPGTVLAPEVLAEATTAQLPQLAGVLPGFGRRDPNPWGLGFELHGTKDPHWMPGEASPAAFGHFGRSGTFLWVDPEAGVACVALTDVPFGDWAAEAWPRFGSRVLSDAAR